jgi:FKBP-type peptidyl-prolyl cis-trans isomerase
MKKGILLTVYVVVAAAIIGAGAWYASLLTAAPAAVPDNSASAPTQAGPGQTQQPAQTSTQQTNNNKTTKTMDGLVIKDDVVGTGATAALGDTVTVNYTGKLDDGTVFDSSLNSGRTPFSFTIGGNVIQGWNEGVPGMKVGGTRELTIPASLGYGAQGAGSVIPPNATLHFTVTLLAVTPAAGR